MKEKKELRVGDKFTYNGKLYLCQYGSSCEDCVFDGFLSCSKPYEAAGSCSQVVRSDGRDVIFVEIGKEKPAVPKTEFALDEEFQYGLKRLKCVKSKPPVIEYSDDCCVECFFFECGGCYSSSDIVGACIPSKRSDGNDVIFVEVEPKD